MRVCRSGQTGWIEVPVALCMRRFEPCHPHSQSGMRASETRVSFARTYYFTIKGNPNEELVEFVERAPQGTLVVMGAFGRKGLSALFHSSLSQVLLDQTRASLFIAHY